MRRLVTTFLMWVVDRLLVLNARLKGVPVYSGGVRVSPADPADRDSPLRVLIADEKARAIVGVQLSQDQITFLQKCSYEVQDGTFYDDAEDADLG